MKIALAALPALALLSACAMNEPPPPPPMAMAPAAQPAPPPPPVTGMDGRYVGTARLVPGQSGCRARPMNVTANVVGDRVTVMSGRRTMEGMIAPGGAVTFNDGTMMTNTRVEDGTITGESMAENCRYTVSLRKAGMPRHRQHAMPRA